MFNLRKKDIFEHIENGNLGYVKKWVKAHPNKINTFKNNHSETPLHWACYWNSNLDIVKLLIDKGVDIHSKDNNGWTPLHRACWYGNLDLVKLLIERGADVNIEDNDGNISLDYLNDENRDIINRYIRHITLKSKIISLIEIDL